MSDTCIELQDVTVSLKSRRGVPRRVLENVTFRISAGERIALVGQNGTGKTTFLRLLLDAVVPDSGAVQVRVDRTPGAIAYVPQDYRNALFPWLSLEANLLIGTTLNDGSAMRGNRTDGDDHLQRYRNLAEEFRLEIDLAGKPKALSGGQQQLFLLVKALISRPKLLVLDEPLSAIDFGRKQVIAAYLGRSLADGATTVVFASHDFDESALLADRVVVLGQSRGVKSTITVPLPWPRTTAMQRLPEFLEVVEKISKEVA
jgi:NitT/TauT family transport system ATP-binding protein